MKMAHLRDIRRRFPIAELPVGMHGKRGIIEFGLGAAS